MITKADEFYMRRAVSLAKRGGGWVHPNPLVGAVIVKDGDVIGEGFHERYGELHAERNALKNAVADPCGATIYVTLEPCCHTGKQPPCTEALIEAGIKRVVVGSADPNPKVAGKGIRQLRDAGIEVEEDCLREECDAINRIFFHYITSGRPYITMKYAMTLDGKTATYAGNSKWITASPARNHVHENRSLNAAIMAGIGTVLSDDPMLNSRMPGGKQPVRLILDSKLVLPEASKIVKTASEYETWVFTCEADEEKHKKYLDAGLKIFVVPAKDGHTDLSEVIKTAGEEKIDSIYVEGGSTVHASLMEEGLFDEIHCYIAPKLFGGAEAKSPVGGRGVEFPYQSPALGIAECLQLGDDIFIRAFRN